MLQKLPKTAGDSINLGSIVALGICPAIDKKSFTRFATFDVKGELVSYELTNRAQLDAALQLFAAIPTLDGQPTGGREDQRFIKTFKGFEIRNSESSVVLSHSD